MKKNYNDNSVWSIKVVITIDIPVMVVMVTVMVVTMITVKAR